MRIHSIASLKNLQKGDYREAGGSVVSIIIVASAIFRYLGGHDINPEIAESSSCSGGN